MDMYQPGYGFTARVSILFRVLRISNVEVKCTLKLTCVLCLQVEGSDFASVARVAQFATRF